MGRGLAAGPRAPRVAHSRDPGLLLSGVFRRQGEPRRGRPGPGGGPGAPDSARRGPLRLALGPPTPPAGLRETERAPVLRRPEAGVLASAAGLNPPWHSLGAQLTWLGLRDPGDPGWPAEPAPAKDNDALVAVIFILVQIRKSHTVMKILLCQCHGTATELLLSLGIK